MFLSLLHPAEARGAEAIAAACMLNRYAAVQTDLEQCFPIFPLYGFRLVAEAECDVWHRVWIMNDAPERLKGDLPHFLPLLLFAFPAG